MKSPVEWTQMLEATQKLMLQEPYRSHSAYGEIFQRDWDECENIARWYLGWRALWFWEISYE